MGELDLSPLSGCQNLRTLTLAGMELNAIDLKPLMSCTNLEGIILSGNNLSKVDLSPFFQFENLGHINLLGNNLESLDITHILRCPNLTTLLVDDIPLIQRVECLRPYSKGLKRHRKRIRHTYLE